MKFIVPLVLSLSGVHCFGDIDLEALFRDVQGSGIAQLVNNHPEASLNEVDELGSASPTFGTYTPGGNLPVVQMHGMGDFGRDPFGMVPLAKEIAADLDTYVLSMQIGANVIADIMNGFLMNLDDQVDEFARQIQADSTFQDGFNAVGYSQGNLVIRGYIEKYNTPPVHNFISMHGPLMGVAGLPKCNMTMAICKTIDAILYIPAYTDFVQEHLAQANYFRDPTNLDAYLAKDKFLAYVNNEVLSADSDAYKARLASLSNLVLVKADLDSMVYPNDSEWFGYYQDGTLDAKWNYDQTPWYLADSFGLQTLDNAGGLVFQETDGDHLQFSDEYLLELVNTYFVNN